MTSSSDETRGGIVRVQKTGGYTVLDNTAANDNRLSFKALGLHTYLLTKPDNWKVFATHLATVHQDGRDAVLSGLRELEENGYLIRRNITDEQGRITGRESVVFEQPQSSGKTVIRKTRNTEKPSHGKPATSKYLDSISPDLKETLTLPDWLPEEAWTDFLAHRKALKAPVTELSGKRLLKTLTDLRGQGHDPVKVIDQTIATGKWTGLFPLKANTATSYQQTGTVRGQEAAFSIASITVEEPDF